MRPVGPDFLADVLTVNGRFRSLVEGIQRYAQCPLYTRRYCPTRATARSQRYHPNLKQLPPNTLLSRAAKALLNVDGRRNRL